MSFEDDFRAAFPEFADEVTYSEGVITYWYDVAVGQMAVERWGNMLAHGINLFVAHNISIQAANARVVAMGGFPGQDFGKVTSKSAGSVSASMDTQSVIIQDGGDYNLTTYGIQFLRLAKIRGIGGLYIS